MVSTPTFFRFLVISLNTSPCKTSAKDRKVDNISLESLALKKGQMKLIIVIIGDF